MVLFTYRQIEGAALIGIDVAKEDDLAEWYQQVITKGQMISYYDVSCIGNEPIPAANKRTGRWLLHLGTWQLCYLGEHQSLV